MREHPYYWDDPLKERFDITIDSIIEANGYTYVKILENVVKPSGGGQAGDRGRIEIDGTAYEFMDTVLLDNVPMLQMKDTPPIRGNAVLAIDMVWRGAMMSNHTSEHLFVGTVKKKHPDIELGRIWIDGNRGAVELEGRSLTIEEVLEAESQVQKHIEQAIPVKTEVTSARDIDESVRTREGVTSKHDIIRIVRVGDLDSSACAGIHVTNTREICVFKVVDFKSRDKDTHIEFLSGSRAVESLCCVYNAALLRKYSYPFELEQLGAVLDKAKSLQTAHEESLQKIIQLMTDGPHKEQMGSIRFWYEYLPGMDAGSMRSVMKQLPEIERSTTLLFAPGPKSSFILWTKSMPKDASYYIQEPVLELGGHGGGSKESFTGGFADVKNALDLYQQLVEKVRKRISGI
ncbi:MAG: hypothetical protein C4K48_09585 [Candidatus Thorarchaeota archaeon]|nr:MAG: hypothetical protein C4K48_09585 [Candidatus Thorarchaeota archaeon]